jgi:uncharacterized protein (TIGR01777 family)
MNTRILIAGGTGFIGKELVAKLVDLGYHVHLLTRNANRVSSANITYFLWNIDEDYIDTKAFENVTTIINLTGANISEKRWTTERKLEIINSRIKPLELIYKYVYNNKNTVKQLISSSAVGYYGAYTTDEIYTEDSSSGDDFIASVCKLWESKALAFNALGIATVILRKGVVIGFNDGIYKKVAPFSKRGLSISVGKGNHYLPWIDIRDLVNLYLYFIYNPDKKGVYNTVSNEYCTMNNFSDALLKSFHKQKITPNIPQFLLKVALGEMAVMLLEGSRISNTKLLDIGFQFTYKTIDESVQR